MPEGLDGAVLASLAREAGSTGKPILHIARDAQRLVTLEETIAFFAPEVKRLNFPAWDGVPYDRVAPNAEIIARRIATLAELAGRKAGADGGPLIVLTTLNAVLQRVPPHDYFAGVSQRLAAGNTESMASLIGQLESLGYGRAGTVTDPGQYAVRGGNPRSLSAWRRSGPSRFLRRHARNRLPSFDPETQRSHGRLESLSLLPMSEAPLTEDARKRFRTRYVEMFGPASTDDPLYESVSAGRQHQGMEHWLPLFHERLETLFDFVPGAVVVLDPLVDDARRRRLEQVADHYDARQQALERKAFGAPPYNPVPPDSLFLTEQDWTKDLSERQTVRLDPFEHPDEAQGATIVSFNGRRGRSFAPERQQEGIDVFDAVVAHAERLKSENKRVLVACWSKGAKERSQRFCTSTASARRFASRHGRTCWLHRRRRQASACSRSKPASRRRTSPSLASRTFLATAWCAAPGQSMAATR